MELNNQGSFKWVFYLIVLGLFFVGVVHSQNSSQPENRPPVFLGDMSVPVIVTAEPEAVETPIDEVDPVPLQEPQVVMQVKEEPDAKLVARKQKVEHHKDKLNQKTQEYLESVSDSTEEKRYLVKTRKPQKLPEGVQVHKEYESIDVLSVSTTPDTIGDVLEDEDVELIELDQEISTLSDSIPYGVQRVGAPGTWNFTQGNGIAIAVLDTGISAHPDLQIAGGVSVVGGDYSDTHGHGTGVAGVISARLNNEGLVGVAPEAEIYAVKVMDGASGSLSDAIAGVEWAIEHNMSIVSMSFGMETYSQIFKEVLEDAYASGILLVAASGNTGDGEVLYPAAYSSVIAVGAVDESDQKASFSSYGLEVELVAAGVDINTTGLNEDYVVGDGTSYSVGYVTGVSALIWAYNQTISNQQVRAKLQQDALDLGTEGRDSFYGYGLVQVNMTYGNSILSNESYHYRVYSYFNYPSDNNSLKLWLDGFGSIDDVNFSQGMYFVRKYIADGVYDSELFVSDNSQVSILDVNPIISFDGFISDSSSGIDGFSWAGDSIFVAADPDNLNLDDAYCINFNYSTNNNNFNGCYYNDTTDKNDCIAYSEGLSGNAFKFYDHCQNLQGTCALDQNLDRLFEISFGSKKTDTVLIRHYEDCDASSGISSTGTDSQTYYFIDKRESLCTSTTTWNARGRYESPEVYAVYKSLSCNASQQCDTFAQTNSTTETGTINPCRQAAGYSCTNTSECLTGLTCNGGVCGTGSVCNGTIEVITEDSQANPLNNLSVFLNGVQKNSTDLFGLSSITTTNAVCGAQYNLTVKCQNQIACDSKIGSIDNNSDTDPFVFDCSICLGIQDISISKDTVKISKQGSNINVSLPVKIEAISGNNLDVNFTVVNKDGSLGSTAKFTIATFPNNTKRNASALLTFTSNSDKVNIFVDPDNAFINDSKSNNLVSVPAIAGVKAYLDISTGVYNAQNVIKNFLEQYVDSVPQDQEQVQIHVRVLSISPGLPSKSSSFDTWLINSGQIKVDGRHLNRPYEGLVASFKDGTTNRIYVVGVGIEGTLAATKSLIDSRSIFLSEDNLGMTKKIVLDGTQLDYIRIYDFMHNDKNDAIVKNNFGSSLFEKIALDSLEQEFFDSSVKLVRTADADNVTLRMYHFKNTNQGNYKSKTMNLTLPVVLAHGIHSNLESWKDFGEILSQKGNDVWLIEPYGGPDTECENCPMYNFADLKDTYWPALIAGVQAYSGQNNLSYIGYDLGCTVALESLEAHPTGQTDVAYYKPTQSWVLTDLEQRPINTFVGIGCLGNFTLSNGYPNGYWPWQQYPIFADFINNTEQYETGSVTYNTFDGHLPGYVYKGQFFVVSQYLSETAILGNILGLIGISNPVAALDYVALASVAVLGAALPYPGFNDNKISMGVYQDFQDWIRDPNQPKPGVGVPINNLVIVQGKYERDRTDNTRTNETLPDFRINTDGFVSNLDQLEICKNVISSNKRYLEFKNVPHFKNIFEKGLAHEAIVHRAVTNLLGDINHYNSNSGYSVLSASSNCG